MSQSRSFSRRGRVVGNRLGVISNTKQEMLKTLRRPDLDEYDAYYEGRQYDHLADWDDNKDASDQHIKLKNRKPKITFAFAKVLSSRLASKLVGKTNFPKWKVEDDPETEDFVRVLLQTSSIRSKLVEPIRRMFIAGSVFVRFSILNGQWQVQHYQSKWCFPKFDANNQLTEMEIKYVYSDPEDLDENRLPKKKWYKLTIGQKSDVLYDNPDFNSQHEPEFKVVNSVTHGLGYVQGEWMRTTEEPNEIDGQSFISDILDFIDEMNYSISQSSDAIAYNQDPQILLKAMDDEEIGELIRSSARAWNLGREGEASLLEASMTGTQMAMEFRGNVRLSIQDVSRIVLLDPEKMVGHAQSAKAMEVLHGPLVELIEEIQPQIEKHLKSLFTKMILTVLLQNELGSPVPINIPQGYRPKSLNLIANFPPIFPQTMEDLQKKVQVASTVSSANLISRETLTKWLGIDFGVEDVEEEVRKVNDQKIINPFGGF